VDVVVVFDDGLDEVDLDLVGPDLRGIQVSGSVRAHDLRGIQASEEPHVRVDWVVVHAAGSAIGQVFTGHRYTPQLTALAAGADFGEAGRDAATETSAKAAAARIGTNLRVTAGLPGCGHAGFSANGFLMIKGDRRKLLTARVVEPTLSLHQRKRFRPLVSQAVSVSRNQTRLSPETPL
jgi:hypothetical protein